MYRKLAESNKNPHLIVTKKISFKDYHLFKFKEDEIIIDGELYDILEEKFGYNTVTLKLFKDKKEKSFLLKIKNTHKKNNSSKGKNNIKTKIIYFTSLNEADNLVIKKDKTQSLLSSLFFIKDVYLSIIVPPPDFI